MTTDETQEKPNKGKHDFRVNREPWEKRIAESNRKIVAKKRVHIPTNYDR